MVLMLLKRRNISWEQRGTKNVPVRWRPHYKKLHPMEVLMCESSSVGYKINRKNIQMNI